MTPKDKQKKEKAEKKDIDISIEQEKENKELEVSTVYDQVQGGESTSSSIEMLNKGESEDIDELISLKEDFYLKGDYADSIVIAEKIIRLARKDEKKELVQEHEKFITKVHKDMKKKYADANMEEIIGELIELRGQHEFNLKFEDAINVARRIIHIALVTKKKDHIVQQEEYIKSLKKRIKQKPSKFELVEKIEKLKGIKQEHIVKGEEDKAVDIARQIIGIAKIASIDSVVAEEEKYIKSIKELWDKETLISNAIDELKDQKSDYDILIKYNAIKEAHKMVEDFSTKYQEHGKIFSDSFVKEFMIEDKKNWVKYSVSTEKSDAEEKELGDSERKKIVKLELEKVKIEEEKSRLRRELAKLKRKLEYSEVGQLKLELDKKNAELDLYKKRLESKEQRLEEHKEDQISIIEKEQQEIELQKAQLEEEKTRLKLEALKLEKSKDFGKEENTIVQLEKTELEEEKQRLTTEITRLMEDKEQLQREQLKFEEEMEEKKELLKEKFKILEDKDAQIKELKTNLEEEKEKFEWEKLKLEEEKKKLEEDKQKVQEIKQKLMDL